MKSTDITATKMTECVSPVLVPYDAKAASHELRRKKMRGEVSREVKLPKKRTLEQLRREYADSKWSEIEDSVRHELSYEAFNQIRPLTQTEKLLDLCRTIANTDDYYQGLWSEVERAKEDAAKILTMAEEIKAIIDSTKQEDARMAQNILKILDVPFKRVLGDKLDDLMMEGTDLESWLKTQYYRNERLRELVMRENYVQAIFRYSSR